jgi:hypothetical protein
MKFLENYIYYFLKVITHDKNYDTKYNEITALEFIDELKSNFLKSLTSTSMEERIIRPFIHAFPENICYRENTNQKYHSGFNKINCINNDTKPNMTFLIFYCNKVKPDKKLDKHKYLDINITNSINIKWLISALPNFYRPSNFVNVYKKIKSDTNEVIIETSDSPIWNYISNKVHNEWNTFCFPFESDKLPSVLTYLNNLKKNIIIYE